MHEKEVKRLPVVDKEGELVGIVSRGDVLKVFLRPDAEIRREVIEGVLIHTLWMDPAGIKVTVTQGVVCLEGTVDRRSDIPFMVRLVTAVDGVVGVRESLSFRFDDLHTDSHLPWAASGSR
jgi:CBS-domain-containing membrane protein